MDIFIGFVHFFYFWIDIYSSPIGLFSFACLDCVILSRKMSFCPPTNVDVPKSSNNLFCSGVSMRICGKCVTFTFDPMGNFVFNHSKKLEGTTNEFFGCFSNRAISLFIWPTTIFTKQLLILHRNIGTFSKI